MAANSNIEWTDHTINFWWGCTKVGPGCDHCYAETLSNRFDHPSLWGVGAPRRKIKSAVSSLNKLQSGWVFIQSMADIFDNEVDIEWFAEAWAAIKFNNHVRPQILTKRVSIVEKRLAAIGETQWPQHAGLMITVVNQEEANRDVPRLLELKKRLSIPWVGLSCEPLLGPVNLRCLEFVDALGREECWDALDLLLSDGEVPSPEGNAETIDFVIVGGESGPKARVWDGFEDAARSIMKQCAATRVPFFMKQMAGPNKAKMPPIPDDLMVRQFPEVPQ